MHDRSALRYFACVLALCGLLPAAAHAADDVAQVVEKKAPESVAAPVAALLSDKAIAVTIGGKPLCHVWLAKSWNIQADFQPSPSVLYPFGVGQFIGVIEYAGSAEDFRKQQVARGVYTLRYGQQPEDGNHVGTSDTRDFLVLLPVAKDAKPEPMPMDDMHKLSKEVTRATHPAILSMLTAQSAAPEPQIRHYADRELHALRVDGQGKAGAKSSTLTVEFVLVGHAPE